MANLDTANSPRAEHGPELDKLARTNLATDIPVHEVRRDGPDVPFKQENFIKALEQAGYKIISVEPAIRKLEDENKPKENEKKTSGAPEPGAGYATVVPIVAIAPGEQEPRKFALKFVDPTYRLVVKKPGTGQEASADVEPSQAAAVEPVPPPPGIDPDTWALIQAAMGADESPVPVEQEKPKEKPIDFTNRFEVEEHIIRDTFPAEVNGLQICSGLPNTIQSEGFLALPDGRVVASLSSWYEGGRDLDKALTAGEITREAAIEVVIESIKSLSENGARNMDPQPSTYMVRPDGKGGFSSYLLVDPQLVRRNEPGEMRGPDSTADMRKPETQIMYYVDSLSVRNDTPISDRDAQKALLISAVEKVRVRLGLEAEQPLGTKGLCMLIQDSTFGDFLHDLDSNNSAQIVAKLVNLDPKQHTADTLKETIARSVDQFAAGEALTQELRGLLKERAMLNHSSAWVRLDPDATPEANAELLLAALKPTVAYETLAALRGGERLDEEVRALFRRVEKPGGPPEKTTLANLRDLFQRIDLDA